MPMSAFASAMVRSAAAISGRLSSRSEGSVPWTWSKRHANELARKRSNGPEDWLTLNRIPAGRANWDGWTLFYPRSNTPAPDCNQRSGACGLRTLGGHARSVDAKIQSTYFGELPPLDPARFSAARPFAISPDAAII